MTMIRGMDGRAAGTTGSCAWCGRPLLAPSASMIERGDQRSTCGGCGQPQIRCICGETVSGRRTFARPTLEECEELANGTL